MAHSENFSKIFNKLIFQLNLHSIFVYFRTTVDKIKIKKSFDFTMGQNFDFLAKLFVCFRKQFLFTHQNFNESPTVMVTIKQNLFFTLALGTVG